MLLCSKSDRSLLHTFERVLFIRVNELQMKRNGGVVIVTLQ